MGARSIRLTLAKAAAIAAILLAPLPTMAAVDLVVPTPDKVKIATNGSARLAVTWRVGRSLLSAPPLAGTIASARADILIGGEVVGSISRRLQQSTQGLSAAETFVFKETLQLPSATVYRAIKLSSPILVRRTFSDSAESGDADGEVTVIPSGPGSATLSIQRLSLTFDDDSRTTVLQKDGRLRAIAELNISGVGLLAGQWEVASSFSTAGTPVFRPLILVRQGVADTGRTVITSPLLPTSVEGANFVRFRVTNPETTFDEVALQYYVTPRPGTEPPLREITVTGPRPGAPLGVETRFAWLPLPGATAYRLELFAAPIGPSAPKDPDVSTGSASTGAAARMNELGGQIAVVGVAVTAIDTETDLSSSSLAQLPGDKSYLWKVSAIDANGAVIGASSARKIYKP